MFFLVYVDMGSFAVCHCKELTENPAYRTFLQDPNFSYLEVFFFKGKLSLFRGKWRAVIFFGSGWLASWEANKHKAKLRMLVSTVCPCLPMGSCRWRLCWTGRCRVRDGVRSAVRRFYSPCHCQMQEGPKPNITCGRGHWCGCSGSFSLSRFGVSLQSFWKPPGHCALESVGQGTYSRIWTGLSKLILLYKAEHEDCD